MKKILVSLIFVFSAIAASAEGRTFFYDDPYVTYYDPWAIQLQQNERIIQQNERYLQILERQYPQPYNNNSGLPSNCYWMSETIYGCY